jgi:hypothetical protein
VGGIDEHFLGHVFRSHRGRTRTPGGAARCGRCLIGARRARAGGPEGALSRVTMMCLARFIAVIVLRPCTGPIQIRPLGANSAPDRPVRGSRACVRPPRGPIGLSRHAAEGFGPPRRVARAARQRILGWQARGVARDCHSSVLMPHGRKLQW